MNLIRIVHYNSELGQCPFRQYDMLKALILKFFVGFNLFFFFW